MIRTMASRPVIGRFIRIAVAVVRLPEFRAEYLAAVSVPYRTATSDASGFEAQQLPTLLRTVSELNHRQLSSDNDRANLVQSVPIALRRMTRDIIEAQAATNALQLECATRHDRNEAAMAALRAELVPAELVNQAMLRQELAVLRAEIATAAEIRDEAVRRDMQAMGAPGLRQQLDNATESITYLLGRVEFVRREVMFEMRYGGGKQENPVSSTDVKGEILSTEKVAAARKQGARINLGCGHIALDNYLNVDRRPLPGVDIVAEVNQLPFERAELQEIFSSHLLEHFPQEQLRRELLPYYFSLLREGGKFAAVVPDAEAMLREYSNGSYPYADLREVLYGGQDYDGDFHFNMFTPASMGDYLREAGFVNVQLIEGGRKNGQCYEFEITADKPPQGVTQERAS